MKLSTDLFLKTYEKDYDWLPYLFRSIVHNLRGYDRLIVVIEDQENSPDDILCAHGPRRWSIERCRRYEGTEVAGYVGQSIEKLRAWEYSTADRVVFLDSDCVVSRPVDLGTDPAASITKPIVLWREWQEAGDANCWHDSTAELLGFEPPHETMCRHPAIFPAWMLHELWEHIGGEDALRAVLSASNMANDFNLMGNFALAKHPELFTPLHWQGPVDNHSETAGAFVGDGVPPEWVHQFWSHHRAEHPDVQKVLGKLGLL
jgi:hypothetical protein